MGEEVGGIVRYWLYAEDAKPDSCFQADQATRSTASVGSSRITQAMLPGPSGSKTVGYGSTDQITAIPSHSVTTQEAALLPSASEVLVNKSTPPASIVHVRRTKLYEGGRVVHHLLY